MLDEGGVGDDSNFCFLLTFFKDFLHIWEGKSFVHNNFHLPFAKNFRFRLNVLSLNIITFWAPGEFSFLTLSFPNKKRDKKATN